MNRSYSRMLRLPSFEERFQYLKLEGSIGERTFGGNRHLNQAFYTSREWRRIRDEVIIRDNGCDLAIPEFPIHGRIYIHHINPITENELKHGIEIALDLDNLVCVSDATHRAIHYGDLDMLTQTPIQRRPNDTCPWKETIWENRQ